MNEKENKKVTRRKFLEDSSKKALAGTAAAFLGLGMIKPKHAQAASGCWEMACIGGCSGACGGCASACSSCVGSCINSCSGTCSNVCTGCTSSCSGACQNTCTIACSGDCSGTCLDGCNTTCTSACTGTCHEKCDLGGGPSAADQECGTPVTEREASARQVTV